MAAQQLQAGIRPQAPHQAFVTSLSTCNMRAGGKDERKEPAYGADVLRLWVASVDYTSDVMIGPGIIKQVRGQWSRQSASCHNQAVS